MSPRVSPRPREAESSFVEYRSRREKYGEHFATAFAQDLFWRYLVEKVPVLEDGFGGERVATFSDEEQRTLSRATGPAGGFLVPQDFDELITSARRARNVIGTSRRITAAPSPFRPRLRTGRPCGRPRAPP